ncbi:MAG: deoxynucleoside kinase [Planctomycetota bacterium]
MPHRNYVAMAGAIGVGKSTVARMLAEALGARLMEEPLACVPSLEAFYRDPETYALQVPLEFMHAGAEQLKNLHIDDHSDSVFVGDYLFEKEEVFAAANLSGDEYRLWEATYREVEPTVPKPGTVIYVRAPVEVLLRRIAERGRSFESTITSGYLARLVAGYDRLLRDDDRVIELTSDRESIDRDSPTIRRLLEVLARRLKEPDACGK